jgi:Uma2 family endonuclease
MFPPYRPLNPTLPTMYDLPSEDPEEPGLPDEFHGLQPRMLTETCLLPTENPFFVAADLNLYYDTENTSWHKRPDWFLVMGVAASRSQAELRWSYVLWQEGIVPFLVVELLSPGTESEDLGQTLRVVGKPPTKWQVYEQILGVPNYVVYDRTTNRFRHFQRQDGRYQETSLDERGVWFPELEVGLRTWQGTYQGVSGRWLRWFDRNGQWLPTEAERTAQEAQRADREAERADRLAAKLRDLGIDPERDL